MDALNELSTFREKECQEQHLCSFSSHILKGGFQLWIHTSSWREHKRQRWYISICSKMLIFFPWKRAVLSERLAQIYGRVKSWPTEVNKSFAADISKLEFLLLPFEIWKVAWTSAKVGSNKLKCSFLEIFRFAAEGNLILLQIPQKLGVH